PLAIGDLEARHGLGAGVPVAEELVEVPLTGLLRPLEDDAPVRHRGRTGVDQRRALLALGVAALGGTDVPAHALGHPEREARGAPLPVAARTAGRDQAHLLEDREDPLARVKPQWDLRLVGHGCAGEGPGHVDLAAQLGGVAVPAGLFQPVGLGRPAVAPQGPPMTELAPEPHGGKVVACLWTRPGSPGRAG